MFRIILKIALFPLVVLLSLASLTTKASIYVGARVGALIINLFAFFGIVNLIGKDIPCALISGVVILLVLAILFFAANLELLFDTLRDSLKRI